MKQFAGYLLLAGLLALPQGVRAAQPETLGDRARAVLKTHCAGCHAGGKAKGGFGFVLDRDQLIDRLLVVPGKSGQSDLFVRIAQNEMPPKSAKMRPSPAELKVLESWIDAGAPAFDRPSSLVTKTPSEQEVALAVLADLRATRSARPVASPAT